MTPTNQQARSSLHPGNPEATSNDAEESVQQDRKFSPVEHPAAPSNSAREAAATSEEQPDESRSAGVEGLRPNESTSQGEVQQSTSAPVSNERDVVLDSDDMFQLDEVSAFYPALHICMRANVNIMMRQNDRLVASSEPCHEQPYPRSAGCYTELHMSQIPQVFHPPL